MFKKLKKAAKKYSTAIRGVVKTAGGAALTALGVSAPIGAALIASGAKDLAKTKAGVIAGVASAVTSGNVGALASNVQTAIDKGIVSAKSLGIVKARAAPPPTQAPATQAAVGGYVLTNEDQLALAMLKAGYSRAQIERVIT